MSCTLYSLDSTEECATFLIPFYCFFFPSCDLCWLTQRNKNNTSTNDDGFINTLKYGEGKISHNLSIHTGIVETQHMKGVAFVTF